MSVIQGSSTVSFILNQVLLLFLLAFHLSTLIFIIFDILGSCVVIGLLHHIHSETSYLLTLPNPQMRGIERIEEAFGFYRAVLLGCSIAHGNRIAFPLSWKHHLLLRYGWARRIQFRWTVWQVGSFLLLEGVKYLLVNMRMENMRMERRGTFARRCRKTSMLMVGLEWLWVVWGFIGVVFTYEEVRRLLWGMHASMHGKAFED